MAIDKEPKAFVKCRYCNIPFKNKERRSQHIKDAHDFMCDGCDKWFDKDAKRKMIGEFTYCIPCYKGVQ